MVPDSETPPGHWFVLLNTTSDHPMMEKKYRGQGEILDDLPMGCGSRILLWEALCMTWLFLPGESRGGMITSDQFLHYVIWPI